MEGSDHSQVRNRVLGIASYTIVALVCLARPDGVFTFRDLSWTDTEVYYRAASRWLGGGLVTVDRAPLYAVLLAAARKVIDDATIVVPAHRAIAALVLTVLRPNALCCYLGSSTGTCAGIQIGGLLPIDEPIESSGAVVSPAAKV